MAADDKKLEAELINFKGIDVWIPAGGVLLVLASDPLEESHPIAGGLNIKHKGVTWDATAKEYEIDDNTEHLPLGATSLYYVAAGFDIPDGDTLIILRNAHDKAGTFNNLLDVNGGLSIPYTATTHATSLWPLRKRVQHTATPLTVVAVERSKRVLSIRRIMQAAVPVTNTGQNAVIPVSVISVLLIMLLMVEHRVMLTVLRKRTTKTPTMKCMLRRLLPSARLCIIPVETCRSGLSFTTILSQTVSTLTVGRWKLRMILMPMMCRSVPTGW